MVTDCLVCSGHWTWFGATMQMRHGICPWRATDSSVCPCVLGVGFPKNGGREGGRDEERGDKREHAIKRRTWRSSQRRHRSVRKQKQRAERLYVGSNPALTDQVSLDRRWLKGSTSQINLSWNAYFASFHKLQSPSLLTYGKTIHLRSCILQVHDSNHILNILRNHRL